MYVCVFILWQGDNALNAMVLRKAKILWHRNPHDLQRPYLRLVQEPDGACSPEQRNG